MEMLPSFSLEIVCAADRSGWRVYSDEIQRDVINVRLRKVLESGDDGSVEAVRKAIDFYQACMNITAIQNLGAKPLYELARMTGKVLTSMCTLHGWPKKKHIICIQVDGHCLMSQRLVNGVSIVPISTMKSSTRVPLSSDICLCLMSKIVQDSSYMYVMFTNY